MVEAKSSSPSLRELLRISYFYSLWFSCSFLLSFVFYERSQFDAVEFVMDLIISQAVVRLHALPEKKLEHDSAVTHSSHHYHFTRPHVEVTCKCVRLLMLAGYRHLTIWNISEKSRKRSLQPPVNTPNEYSLRSWATSLSKTMLPNLGENSSLHTSLHTSCPS